jgi:hypothetical protein
MAQTRFFDADLGWGLAAGALAAALALALWWPRPAVPGVPPVAVASASASASARTAASPAAATPAARQLDLGSASVAEPLRRVAQWVVASADNGSRPFVLLDKRGAQLLLFDPGGRLLGSTPVLLGYARGDDSVPGIGERPISAVRPSERTTPAGRFVAEPGRNTLGEEVLWVDYEAAVSMHRVRLGDPGERRAQRLATPSPADNRISYGCINLPASFFEQQLWPAVRSGGAIVYVLPEQRPLDQVFPALGLPQAQAPAATPTRQAASRHIPPL